ncbi:MAG: hypothetical protein ACR2O6_02245 [Ilumatobacteraceae bacterium]
MNLSLTARALIAAALGAIAVITPTDAGAVNNGRDVVVDEARLGKARFNGREIDLQKGWGNAKACHVAEDLSVTCYGSERAMDNALGVAHRAGGDYPSSANGYASCGSSLRLYSYNYYGSPVLYLTTRWSWTNLSWFGFNNRTSSYRVGGCSALFRSGSYGGGSTYPGPTWAWARRSTMGWSWDNVLSSTYIY